MAKTKKAPTLDQNGIEILGFLDEGRPLAAPLEAEKSGVLRRVGDIGVAAGQGVVSGVKMLTDLAGAGNPVSGALESTTKGLDALYSPARLAERAARAQTIKDAEASGSTLEEIKAHAGGFFEAPVQAVANAAGSMVPTVASAFIPGALPARIAAGAMGVAQGVGAIKGSVYDATERKWLEAGAPPEIAKQKADEEQAYGSKSTPAMIAGGALGLLAGGSGVERYITSGAARAGLGGAGVVARGARGAIAEAIPEGAQGGQERQASNVALQNQGFDVPTWQGVAGSAVAEALPSAPLGGGMAAFRPAPLPTVTPPAPGMATGELNGVPPSSPAIQPAPVDVAGQVAARRSAAQEAVRAALDAGVYGADAGPMPPAAPPAGSVQGPAFTQAIEPTPGPLARAAETAAGAQAGQNAAAAAAGVDPAQRLAELEQKATGTKDQKVPGPDGKPVTIPGTPAQFLTDAEKAERDSLKGSVPEAAVSQARTPAAMAADPLAAMHDEANANLAAQKQFGGDRPGVPSTNAVVYQEPKPRDMPPAFEQPVTPGQIFESIEEIRARQQQDGEMLSGLAKPKETGAIVPFRGKPPAIDDKTIDGDGLYRVIGEATAAAPDFADHTDLAGRAFAKNPRLTLEVLRDPRIDHEQETVVLRAITRGGNATAQYAKLALEAFQAKPAATGAQPQAGGSTGVVPQGQEVDAAQPEPVARQEGETGVKEGPPAAPGAAPAGEGVTAQPGAAQQPTVRLSSQEWVNQGKSPADLIVERSDSLGKELAAVITQEASGKDFAPNDLPTAVRDWADQNKVPADDLRQSVLKALGDFGLSEGRIQQIKRALSPIKTESATAPPLTIDPVSDATMVIRGSGKHKEAIKAAGGKWNGPQKGWIFPKAREAQVRAALGDLVGKPAQETSNAAGKAPEVAAPGVRAAGDQPAGDARVQQSVVDGQPGRMDDAAGAPAPRSGEDSPVRSPASRPPAAVAKKRAKDPFLAFVGDQGGISSRHQREVTGEVGKKGNRLIQYAGPMFRKNGKPLDELARLAVEAGFLTQADIDSDLDNGGVNKITEMLRRAHAGEGVKTAAQQERDFEQQMADFDQYDTADLDLTAADYEDAVEGATADEQQRIESLTGRLVELLGDGAEAEIDRIIRLTEGLSLKEYADELARAVETASRVQGSDQGAGAQGGAGRQEVDPGEQAQFSLEAPTAEGLKTRAAQDQAREQDQARRAAAPAPEDFTLTGSDSRADRAIAAGQMELGAVPAVSANTIVTEDAAAAARARLKAKLTRLNSNIDPEMMMDGITLAVYHVERGARTFAAYAQAMLADLGEGVRPYLKSWYMGVRYDPRAAGLAGMDGAAAVDAADVDRIQLGAAPDRFKDYGAVESEVLDEMGIDGDAGDLPADQLAEVDRRIELRMRGQAYPGMAPPKTDLYAPSAEETAARVKARKGRDRDVAADANGEQTAPKEGKNDVPSPDARVERNRDESAAQSPVDGSVSPGRRGAAGGVGAAGGRASGAGRAGQPDGVGLSSGGAAAGGERGDLSVPAGDGPVVTADIATGSLFGERGSDIGVDGVSVDPVPAAQVAGAASGSDERADRQRRQRLADRTPVKPGDLANIRETLPYLLDGQQEDVYKAEARFAKPDGYGMLFTNGTGTGKTFTGLGIVKRLARQGKDASLIAVPDDKIAADWVAAGQVLGLDIAKLEDTKSAGSGVVITTYANLGANDSLAARDWDLVVADEAHSLMQSADGTVTSYLANLRAITLHPDGAHQRYTMLHRPDIDALRALNSDIDFNAKTASAADTMAEERARLVALNKTLEPKRDALMKKLREAQDAVKLDVKSRQGLARTRLAALSATPFAYEFTIDWANGYLFDYNEGQADDGASGTGGRPYNSGSNRERFFMQHFGYSMRYNKLNKPDPSKVDTGLMQRTFNGWLKKAGSLSGRMLDVKADYDRRFVLVDSAIGNQIDEALNWLAEQSRGQQGSDRGYSMLRDEIDEKFDYLSRRYLLEAIKATEAVPIVREHLKLGRKVVVFHDYKKGGGFNPFNVRADREPAEDSPFKADFASYKLAVAAFREKFDDLVNMPLGSLPSPIQVFSREFPGLMLINGDEKKASLLERYKQFQDDASGPAVMLVQSAKNKGWSGHDTTGKHQRVLINLGQPTAPTLAIQQEGRIYRTGQVTNAIMRYLNTGTEWEKWAFATTIAGRASTAENLGMGELSRALKDSFIAAFEESDAYPPGHEGEGTGGKERDKAQNTVLSAYDRAKTFYWATQKKTSKTKAAEGVDYFATPEPLGMKMAEWLNSRGGEDTLEPSAGHGAIARWLPETTKRTAVEPSRALRARLAMSMNPSTDRIIDGTFEDLAIVNKYDGIAMNPPFGTGGRTAVDHLAKAATHLRDGGRIVALIPTGPAADKKFDKWFYEEEQVPAKPLLSHPILGDLYAGDTVQTRASWAANGTLVRKGRDGGVLIKVPGQPGDILVSVESIANVTGKGPRTRTVRPAEGLYLAAEIRLPSVTFERAGTAVATRIVVIDKQSDVTRAPGSPSHIDLSNAKDIGELFDRLEDLGVPDRAKSAVQEATAKPGPAAPAAPAVAPVATADRGTEPMIEHTTAKGKVLRGIVRDGLSKEDAQKIDPYTFRKDGGWFIRDKHLKPGADSTTKFSRKAIEQGYISESKWQEMRDGVRRAGVDRPGQAGQEQRGTAGASEGDPARLQRFYHGSADEITPGFNLDHPNRKDAGWLGDGVYVTDDPDLAETYANLKRGAAAPNVLPLAIKVRNPFVADLDDKRRLSRMSKDGVRAFTASLIQQGHDGVVLTYANGTSEVVVFDPAAVRSYHAEFKLGANPSGDLLFSRGTGSDGAKARVQAAVDRIAKAWPNAPQIVVLESMADAPTEVQANDASQRAQGATGEPEGFYHDDGKVYLVASALETDEDVERVLAHEILGHAGLRGAFGIKVLADILDQVAAARPAAIRAKMAEYGLKNTPAMRLVAAEEVLAELAQTQPDIGFVRRAVAAIRTWLRAHGLGLRLTRDEVIRNYILPARRYVKGKGEKAAAPVNMVPAFSREDDVFVNEVLAELAQHDDLFRYSASQKTTLEGVMKDVFAQATYLEDDTRPDEREESGADTRHAFKTDLGKNFYIYERGKDVWADISRLDEGEHGGGIYAAILNYTHNAKKVLIGDPAGLSEAAVVRRTSAMLSSALRFGTTAHMDAATEQRAGDPANGISPLKWQGDDVQKTSALIETFLSTLYTQMPALKGYRYDFRTRQFLDRSGRSVGLDRFTDASRLGISRSARIGEATARRGVFLKSLVSSEGGARPGLLEQVLRRGNSLASGDLRGMFSRKKAVTQARETFADMMQSTKSFNWWNKSIGTQYQKAQQNPTFGKVYNRVQDYIQDISDFGSRAAAQAPTLLPRLDKLRDVLKKPVSAADQKAISKALYAGTLAGESVTDGKLWSDAELRENFSLTDPQISLYREARAAIDQSIDDLGRTEIAKLVGDTVDPMFAQQAREADSMEAAAEALQAGLDEKITEARQDESEDGQRKVAHLRSLRRAVRAQTKRIGELKDAGYMPLMRFGKYAVNVADPNVEGESLHFALFDTEREANAHAREVAPQFPGKQITRGIISDRAAQLMQGIDPATLEIFAEAIGASESEVFQEYLKMVTSQRSAMKRLIERKGTPGFSEDVKRSLAAFITSNARAASGNLHLRDLLLNTSKIKEGDVKDEAIGLVKHVLDPQPDPSAKARSLLFMQFIGGSVASALVNLTQPVTMTLPYLSQYSSPARAANLLRKATLSAIRGVTGDEAAALKRAESDGIVSPQEIHFLYGEAEKAFGSNPLLQRAGFLWGAPFGLAEQFNRRATFIAAYRLGVERKEANPFAFAEKAVIETQGVYNRGNASNWARNPVGGALLTFKQFSVAYLELLKRLPSRERAIALAILALAAGMEGLPGADDLDDLLDTFAQAFGYNWSAKQAKRDFITDTLGPEMAQFATRGVSAFLPLDVSARMGMGNLLPGTGLLMQSRQDKGREVSEVFGAPGGAVQMVGKAATQAMAGEPIGAVSAVLPVALQNLLDPNRGALALAASGQYKDERGRRVVDVDAVDALLKAAGFNPTAVSEPQMAMRIAKQSIDLARAVESDIAGDLAAARVESDSARAEAARARLADWNEKNPDTPIRIEESQIRRRAREMQTTKADRLTRTAPRELREGIRRRVETIED